MATYTKSFQVSVDTMTTPKNSNTDNVVFNQGDLNVDSLTITLTHNNGTMDLTTATDISIFFLKQDSSVSMQNLSNGVSIKTASSGVILLSFNSQTLGVPGTVQAEVHVTFPGNQILIFKRFSFMVEAAILSGASSQNSFQVLAPLQVVSSINALPAPSASYQFLSYGVKGAVGVAEVDALTITAAPNANGNVTVTLNGVATTVAVAQGDTTAAVATKIGSASFTGWTTSVNGSSVTFTKNATGAQSAPSYSPGSTGASGNMVVQTTGVTATADGIYMCKKFSNDSYDWVQYA